MFLDARAQSAAGQMGPSGGRGAVNDLKVIRDLAQLPPFGRNLTDRRQPCEIGAAHRRSVALLERHDGENRCVLVWENRPSAIRARQDAQQLAKQTGWEIVEILEAAPELIDMLYRADWAPQTTVASIEKQEAEHVIDGFLAEGVVRQASDIHLQVHEDRGVLLFRIHGDLVVKKMMRREEAERLSESSFWLCNPDSKGESFKRSEPQDAAMERMLTVGGEPLKLSLRWACIPVQNRWDITMRLLSMGRNASEKSLEFLGYSPAHIAAFERMQGRPVGGIILVGTTGSGKSTTLQTLTAGWVRRHQGRRLLRTIEDPVEYLIPGARQSSVVRRTGSGGEDDGRSFGAMLRGAMRTDPDGLMVGEVRDEVTAQLTQRAIQTGHKVWTTLHAGNPFDAIDRLEDLGIKRAVLGSGEFISGIVFQRLLPVLCDTCKEPWSAGHRFLPEDQVMRVQRAFGADTDALFLRGRDRDCPACSGQGVSGRTVAAEVLMPDRIMNQLIAQADMLTARAYWRSGLARVQPDVREIVGQTALEHAMSKARLGRVSPDDIEQELGLIDDLPNREQDKEFVLSNHPEWAEMRHY